MLRILSFLALLTLSIHCGPAQAQGGDEGTTSSKLVLVAQKMVVEAAKVGLEEAGTRLMGSAWPYLKKAMTPLLDELKHRYPGFARVLDGKGPNAVAEATKVANTISTDPQLQRLLIDGFANLQAGQREIVNRIGAMQAVLQKENQSIMALQKSSDEKLDKILAQVNQLASQKPNEIYTERVSMYDLEGVWTMVQAQPPLASDCEFEYGKYGLSIDAIDAVTADGTYAVPILLGPEQQQALGASTPCITMVSGRKTGSPVVRMALYGSLLRMPLGETFNISREVQASSKRMILSWLDGEGRRRRWIFERNK